MGTHTTWRGNAWETRSTYIFWSIYMHIGSKHFGQGAKASQGGKSAFFAPWQKNPALVIKLMSALHGAFQHHCILLPRGIKCSQWWHLTAINFITNLFKHTCQKKNKTKKTNDAKLQFPPSSRQMTNDSHITRADFAFFLCVQFLKL